MGKLLVVVGMVLLVTGLFITYSDKFFFGKLPGDLSIERENFKFHLPIMSSIVLSVLISIILILINRFKN
jgi:hypothetical protein